MSSLKESLTQRRAAESADLACVSVSAQTSALVLRTWRGESWVLPWAQLLGARLGAVENKDQLELSFVGYLVTISGENLFELLEDLAAFRIACLRDLPADYRSQSGEHEPFIAGIEVRSPPPSDPIREVPE
jgi:hypothetical protein